MITAICKELGLNEAHVRNAIKLLVEEQGTIPFVARYRKEMTGSMDEVTLRTVRDRYEYLKDFEETKAKYLEAIAELAKEKPEIAEKLPALRLKFNACKTKQELEDLYLPFKPKRRTRAQIAREKGLEPLLDQILEKRASLSQDDFLALAQNFVKTTGEDEKLFVLTAQAALAGAGDILAERISETPEVRAMVRRLSFDTGILVSEKAPESKELLANPKKKAQIPKYQNYFSFSESLKDAAAHRIMAMRRGETDKILKLSIDVDQPLISGELYQVLLQAPTSADVKAWISDIIDDSYKRLLAPSIETEIRVELKKKAEEEALKVFSTNLEHLLLLPPIPNQVVLGVDPGLRTGSKLAVISATNKVLAHGTIYPDFDDLNDPKTIAAGKTLEKMLREHHVVYIAVGNGTGSREIDQLILKVLKSHDDFKNIKRVIVNESGASVYSTDDIAREEFPDLDPTIRSAISIARRLQDPLAEFVKIDPKSLGVGQYQHDCHPGKLSKNLQETVESCVNRVGVNLNTASHKLLSYVSGIGASLGKEIVTYRNEHGPFLDRQSLQSVSGFGPKTFELAAGFLRVPESVNPLDNSAVHPERYALLDRISQDQGIPLSDFIGKEKVINQIPLESYVDDQTGMPTLVDLMSELKKPGRDPREDGIRLHYSDTVTTIEDLKIGMTLKGTVSNVTNFGAFVDIGVHQDGLIHVSELSNQFVQDPSKIVAVGNVIEVRVIDVDLERHRISLSAKKEGQTSTQRNSSQENQRQQRWEPRDSRPTGDRPRSSFQSYNPRDSDSRSSAPRSSTDGNGYRDSRSNSQSWSSNSTNDSRQRNYSQREDRSASFDSRNRMNRPDRPDRQDRDRPERFERQERDRPERQERFSRPSRTDRPDHPERIRRDERPQYSSSSRDEREERRPNEIQHRENKKASDRLSYSMDDLMTKFSKKGR